MATHLVEAACLVGLATVPLFSNPFSMRIFEPEKAMLVRALAALVVALGCVRLVAAARSEDAAGSRWLVPLGRPRGWEALAVAIGAFLAATLISTSVSLTPSASLWGSYARLQGAYTSAAYVVLFGGLVATIRRRQQLERVLEVMILASLPVALYAVLQHLGMDPQAASGAVPARATSTQGNPIFLGAYLIMIVPLTLRAALAPAQNGPGWQRGLRVVVFLTIAAVQLAALTLSASRGPIAALAVALPFGLVTWLAALGRRRLALAVLAVALLGAGGLAAVQIGGAGSRVAGPRIGRIAALIDPTIGASRVRMLVWQGMAELVAPHPPLVLADGRTDTLNPLRPLVGYGPESLLVTLLRFVPPELAQVEARDRLPDRAHNEIWEVLAGGGVVGLAAHLGLWLAVFQLAFRRLGLVARHGDAWRLAALVATGVAATTLALVALAGRALFGPAVAIGFAGGLFAYLAVQAVRDRPGIEKAGTAEPMLVAALGAALSAHFVEIQVGIATVSTRLSFWTCVALLVVAGRREVCGEASEHETERGVGASLGLLLALVLVALTYGLVTNPRGLADGGAIARAALLGPLGVVLLSTWLVGGLAALVVARSSQANLLTATGVLSTAAAATGLFLERHVAALAALGAAVPRDLAAVIANGIVVEQLLVRFLLFGLVLLVALGWCLGRGALPRSLPVRSGSPRLGRALVGVAALALAVLAAGRIDLRPLRADVALRSAEDLLRHRRWPEAAAFFARALALAPEQAQYWSRAAHGRHEEARAAAVEQSARREQLMTEATAFAREAHFRDPAHPGHVANLGRLYLWWADATTDPALHVLRNLRAEQADAYLAVALAAMPGDPRLWSERAKLHAAVLGRPGSARIFGERALEIDPTYEPARALLGREAAKDAP